MLALLVIRRLIMAAATLFCVAVVVFILLRVVPGDPIAMMISPGASPDDIATLRARYGLDESMVTQFALWLKAMLSGDLGTSISLNRDVIDTIWARLPATLELAASALVTASLMGTAAAVIGTRLRQRRTEGVLDTINGFFLAVPDFIWALALVLVFGVLYPVFPLSGRVDPSASYGFVTRFYLLESVLTLKGQALLDIASHMAMPMLALALPLAAVIASVLKGSLREAMVQDYIILAKLKGMSEWRLILQEALRNAIGPTLVLTGVQFTFLIGGTVIIERIFAYPGIGNLAIDAVINRDLPLIQGLVLMFGFLFISVNILIDLAVVSLNPRMRHG